MSHCAAHESCNSKGLHTPCCRSGACGRRLLLLVAGPQGSACSAMPRFPILHLHGVDGKAEVASLIQQQLEQVAFTSHSTQQQAQIYMFAHTQTHTPANSTCLALAGAVTHSLQIKHRWQLDRKQSVPACNAANAQCCVAHSYNPLQCKLVQYMH